MDREINVTLTPSLIRWAVYYQLKPILLVWGLILMILGWNSIQSLLHPSNAGLPLNLTLVPLGLFLFFIGFVVITAYQKNMVLIRKMKSPVVKYNLTDLWLYQESELSTGKTAWTAFKHLSKDGKIWRIVSQSGTSLVFPVEALDVELREFLISKLPAAPGLRARPMTLIAAVMLILVMVIYLYQHLSR